MVRLGVTIHFSPAMITIARMIQYECFVSRSGSRYSCETASLPVGCIPTIVWLETLLEMPFLAMGRFDEAVQSISGTGVF